MPHPEPEPPETLRDGRYRGLRVLGRGAQATTYEATDVVGGRQVAIKQFIVRGAQSWKEVELAEREARVLSELSHPLLPEYVEHFEEGGVLYLVTGKIEGESLQALRARDVRFTEADVAVMLRDLGDVLRYLHGLSPPVVHRDIKPGNVVRTPDGRYALVDFGAVRDRLRPEGGSTVVGTFGYMAPEQFQGRAMPVSDVYGVGATALAMLSGREPEDLPHRGLAIDVRATLGRTAAEPMLHALERMLDPDPDRRVPRVARPLEPAARPDGSRRQGESKARRDDPDRKSRKPRKSRPRRDPAERGAWRRRIRVAGSVSRVVMAIGLLIATIAVQIACRVVVPVVLVALSVVFGEALRTAARRVALAGIEASRALDRARDVVWGLQLPDEEADLDPDEAPAGPRVRDPPRARDPNARDRGARAQDKDAAAAWREAEAQAEAEAEVVEEARRAARRGR